ncbi:MAG: hypothetical protein ACREEA_10120, partial [Stellaceae bacterium]
GADASSVSAAARAMLPGALAHGFHLAFAAGAVVMAVALALTLSWKEIPLRAHLARAEPTAEL